jgi:hypothetical protein
MIAATTALDWIHFVLLTAGMLGVIGWAWLSWKLMNRIDDLEAEVLKLQEQLDDAQPGD